MAPLPVKRCKMDSGKESSGESSSSVETITQDFCLTTPEFEKIVKSPAFVDKSLLIKLVFVDENRKTFIITVPRKFGKSTNMLMMKHFAEIQIDSDGNYPASVKDTSNYKLFVENKLQINEESEIMDNHFGKYPVIYADMTCCEEITTFKRAIQFYSEKTQECFKQHAYLLKSEKLSEGNRCSFEDYYSEEKCKKLSEVQVLNGFKHLSELLYKHFAKKCFILIDSYDSIITRNIFTMKNKDTLKKIVKFNVDLLSQILKDNEFAARAVVAGTSYIAGADLCNLKDILCYRFLESHSFVDFYGLTEHEVDVLFKKHNLSEELKSQAFDHYDGYMSKSGKKIFSIWNILNFLKYKKIDNYWKKSGDLENLEDIFQLPSLKFDIETLLQDKSLSMKVKKKIMIEDVLMFRLFMLKPLKLDNDVDPHLYLLYLLEQGYLSFDQQQSNSRVEVKIPNREIKEFYVEKLRKCFINVCKFDKGEIYNCIQAFNNLLRSDLDIKEKLIRFCNKLQQLCSGFSDNFYVGLLLNEVNFHHLIFFIACQTQFKCNTENMTQINESGQVRSDIAMVKDGFGVIVQPDFKGNPRAALHQIIENKYFEVFQNKNFSKGEVDKYMLIGVNMNTHRKISVSVLVNSKNINGDVQDFRSEN